MSSDSKLIHLNADRPTFTVIATVATDGAKKDKFQTWSVGLVDGGVVLYTNRGNMALKFGAIDEKTHLPTTAPGKIGLMPRLNVGALRTDQKRVDSVPAMGGVMPQWVDHQVYPAEMVKSIPDRRQAERVLFMLEAGLTANRIVRSNTFEPTTPDKNFGNALAQHAAQAWYTLPGRDLPRYVAFLYPTVAGSGSEPHTMMLAEYLMPDSSRLVVARICPASHDVLYLQCALTLVGDAVRLRVKEDAKYPTTSGEVMTFRNSGLVPMEAENKEGLKATMCRLAALAPPLSCVLFSDPGFVIWQNPLAHDLTRKAGLAQFIYSKLPRATPVELANIAPIADQKIDLCTSFGIAVRDYKAQAPPALPVLRVIAVPHLAAGAAAGPAQKAAELITKSLPTSAALSLPPAVASWLTGNSAVHTKMFRIGMGAIPNKKRSAPIGPTPSAAAAAAAVHHSGPYGPHAGATPTPLALPPPAAVAVTPATPAGNHETKQPVPPNDVVVIDDDSSSPAQPPTAKRSKPNEPSDPISMTNGSAKPAAAAAAAADPSPHKDAEMRPSEAAASAAAAPAPAFVPPAPAAASVPAAVPVQMPPPPAAPAVPMDTGSVDEIKQLKERVRILEEKLVTMAALAEEKADERVRRCEASMHALRDGCNGFMRTVADNLLDDMQKQSDIAVETLERILKQNADHALAEMRTWSQRVADMRVKLRSDIAEAHRASLHLGFQSNAASVIARSAMEKARAEIAAGAAPPQAS